MNKSPNAKKKTDKTDEKLIVQGLASTKPYLWAVEVSELWLSKNREYFKGDIVRATNPLSGKKYEAVLRQSRQGTKKENLCHITLGLQERLQIEIGQEVELSPVEQKTIATVYVQLLSEIKDNRVLVSQDMFSWILEQKRAHEFRIINRENQAVLLVRKISFCPSDDVSGTDIRLSRYQRELLGLPMTVNRSVKVNCAIVPLAQGYEDTMPKGGRRKLSDRGFGRWLSSKIIRGACTTLSCIRPYHADESFDVVRVTDTTLRLLGIEEGDRVYVSYGDNYVTARALRYADGESMKRMNEKNQVGIDLESGDNASIVVGVPARLRAKLGVPGIGYALTLFRDTGFLFKKHISRQVLPLAAFCSTLLALTSLFVSVESIRKSNSLKLRIITVFICILFLVIAVLFSDLRSRVDKKKSDNDLG